MLRFTAPGTRRSMFLAMLSSAGAAARRGITRCVRSGLRIARPPSVPGAAAVWRRRAKTSCISERIHTSGMRGTVAAAPSATRACFTPFPSTQSAKSGLLDRLIGSLCRTTSWITAHPAAGGLPPVGLAVIPDLAVVLLHPLQRGIELFPIGRSAVQQDGAGCQHADLESQTALLYPALAASPGGGSTRHRPRPIIKS